MLRQLVIHNIALIDEVEIELDNGLNILTGETGAGKSIIIDSINAILGGRVSRELIRTGEDRASVQAVFQDSTDLTRKFLEDQGITPEKDGTIIITRDFTASGKSICRANGRIITLSALKEIGEKLVDIHGQHDNQSLLKTEKHIQMLDCFAGTRLQELQCEYSEPLDRYKDIKHRLKSLIGDEGEKQRKLDIIKYQIDEITKSKLKCGEEEELDRKRIMFANSEKLLSALTSAYELLSGGMESEASALDIINNVSVELAAASRWDDSFDELKKRVDDVVYQLKDIIDDIRNRRDSIEFDQDMLDQLEERLDLIYKLKRKYGSNIVEILEYCRKIQGEMEQLEKSEEIASKLQKELKELDTALYSKACEISSERHNAAGIIEKHITDELEDLEMKKTQFKVNIEFDSSQTNGFERNYNAGGLDKVEFLISTNPGEPLKPLAKIASGGEMSRIMLAVKTILADVDEIPTLIFDEIDIGISGKAAQKVAEKLSLISSSHQVICVTHSAQIACMADNHFLIEKNTYENKTMTEVRKLKNDKVVDEIARILGGGNITGITRIHAEEILDNANMVKLKRKLS